MEQTNKQINYIWRFSSWLYIVSEKCEIFGMHIALIISKTKKYWRNNDENNINTSTKQL